jgi:hypothetical protein
MRPKDADRRLRKALLTGLPVSVTLREPCEPAVLTGVVQRVATTSAFATISGVDFPLECVAKIEFVIQ